MGLAKLLAALVGDARAVSEAEMEAVGDGTGLRVGVVLELRVAWAEWDGQML